jgi:hypothetical protein
MAHTCDEAESYEFSFNYPDLKLRRFNVFIVASTSHPGCYVWLEYAVACQVNHSQLRSSW